MNIFFLSSSPFEAAVAQCDKHVVKMILESAQMLSTAHRVIDGTMQEVYDPVKGKTRKTLVLPEPEKDRLLYRATHVNHPSNVWARETAANYQWLYEHFTALSNEYTHRYRKTHASWEKLCLLLMRPPAGMSPLVGMTEMPLCMPDEFKSSDPIKSYRRYYQSKLDEGMDMRWTRTRQPKWLAV